MNLRLHAPGKSISSKSLVTEAVGLCFLLAFFSACSERTNEGFPQEGTDYVVDATGSKMLLPAPGEIQRVVSLAPSITRQLISLGIDGRIVGITRYCPRTKAMTRATVVGGMFPVNTEQIILLSPDIVLATMEGSSREDISTLRQLGQVVYVMPACAGWRDLKRNFIKLARLLGEGEKAQRMIKEWEERLARMSQRGYPRWRTFCQIGTEPLFTVAKGSHIDEIITRAGLINVFHDAPLRYPRIDREAVLKTNPELILVVTMGEVTARERDRWLLFDSIEACRANRILVASEDLFCSPDPRSFVEALEWLRSRCRGLIVREGSTRPQ